MAIINNSNPITEVPAAGKPAASTTVRNVRAKAGVTVSAVVKKANDEATTTSSKTEIVLKKLKSAKGATLQILMDATGWQAHSVRGFLSGTIKKKLGHQVLSETGKDGLRRYRIAEAKSAG